MSFIRDFGVVAYDDGAEFYGYGVHAGGDCGCS